MIARTFKMMLTVIFLSIFAGCGSSETSESQKVKEQQQPQTDAEHIEQAAFTSLEGDTVRVSDFKGKVVMIDLWETWCKPCLASFPTLQKLQEEYPDNFVVLAVTPGFTDTRKDAKGFAEEHDYTFTYLMDSNNLHKKLGVQGIPYKLYVDAEGKFIKKSLGSYGPGEDYKKIKQIIEKHKSSSSMESGSI